MSNNEERALATVATGWIIVAMAGTFVLFMACASADDVRPFPLNPDYTERYADPGKVDLACYDKGHKDDGQLKQWNDSYCGCVVESTKTVWIARSIKCDLDRVRIHEDCHIRTGPSAAARAACDKA